MLNRTIALFIITLLIVQGVCLAVPKEINLPKPKYSSKVSLEETLLKRRSSRSFYSKEPNKEQLSQILWAAQGITEKTWGWRTAPSAGAIYPLFVYVVNKDGVYEYIPKYHKLILTAKGDKRTQLTRSALGQSFISEAPIVIIITGDFSKNKPKYGGARGARYVCIEVGHVAQNIHLQATALGLGSVPIGAFWDSVAQSNLNIPRDRDPLYIIPLGYPKE